MSYTSKNLGLGDTWDTVKSMSASVDPYLPEAFCRVDQIRALRKDRTALQAMFGKKPTVAVPACVRVPDNKPGGVGVAKVIGKLRAVTYVYEHPIAVWLGLTAVLAVPFLAGFAVGRMKK